MSAPLVPDDLWEAIAPLVPKQPPQLDDSPPRELPLPAVEGLLGAPRLCRPLSNPGLAPPTWRRALTIFSSGKGRCFWTRLPFRLVRTRESSPCAWITCRGPGQQAHCRF